MYRNPTFALILIVILVGIFTLFPSNKASDELGPSDDGHEVYASLYRYNEELSFCLLVFDQRIHYEFAWESGKFDSGEGNLIGLPRYEGDYPNGELDVGYANGLQLHRHLSGNSCTLS